MLLHASLAPRPHKGEGALFHLPCSLCVRIDTYIPTHSTVWSFAKTSSHMQSNNHKEVCYSETCVASAASVDMIGERSEEVRGGSPSDFSSYVANSIAIT